MTWTVIATQNEDAWFSDLVADIIATQPPSLPSHDQKLGHVEVHWHQVAPSLAYIAANPAQGTVDDRLFAENVIWQQLRPHGYKRAVYTSNSVTAAAWGVSPQVEDSAKRLVQSGAVNLDRNSQDTILATVQGDGTDNNGQPDVHQVEIRRQDPQNPGQVTGAFCDCTWGKFMNTPRTRTWKNYQRIPCKHIIATSWVAQSVPTDESRAPGNQGEPGQMSLFDQSGGQAPGSMGLMRQSPFPPGGQSPFAPQGPQMPAQSPTAPPPESVLPPFPMDQQQQLPPVNPASVPGGRPGPTPTNPLQYPGGTFSSIRRSQQEYQNGDLARLKNETMGTLVGRSEAHGAGQPVNIPAGSVGEVLGTDPTTKMVEVLFMGKQFNENSYFEPFGARVWCWPGEITPSANKPPGPAIRRFY